MVPNSMLDRAHEISNKYHMNEEDHMKLINLLNGAHDLGQREGWESGRESGYDQGYEDAYLG